MLSPEESITPYGFKSYDEYFAYIDELIIQNQNNYTLVEILEQVKVHIKEMNIKEDWSVLKYVGESDGAVFGLTHNKNLEAIINRPRVDSIRPCTLPGKRQGACSIKCFLFHMGCGILNDNKV